MGTQARMSESDNRYYSPNRDVAHNFNYVISEVADRIEGGKWDYLLELAKKEGVTDDQLGQVCAALIKFSAVQLDHKKESMASCLSRCGFLELSPAARAIVMAWMGTVYLGMMWSGVREATLGGVGPVQSYQKLRWQGRRMMILMTLPKWRRRLHNLRSRLRRAWRVLTKANLYDG